MAKPPRKSHYLKYDFINPEENFRIAVSTDYDAAEVHFHDFYELIILSSGIAMHYINGLTYRASPGDVFFMYPGDKHSFTPLNEPENLSWISCIWLPEFYDITENINSINKYCCAFNLELHNIYNSMLDEFRAKQYNYLPILKNYLLIMISKLTRMEQLNDLNNYSSHRKEILIKNAINYNGYPLHSGKC